MEAGISSRLDSIITIVISEQEIIIIRQTKATIKIKVGLIISVDKIIWVEGSRLLIMLEEVEDKILLNNFGKIEIRIFYSVKVIIC